MHPKHQSEPLSFRGALDSIKSPEYSIMPLRPLGSSSFIREWSLKLQVDPVFGLKWSYNVFMLYFKILVHTLYQSTRVYELIWVGDGVVYLRIYIGIMAKRKE